MHLVAPENWPRALRRRARRRPRRGQALVEFALIILPLLLLVVGIIQFGLLYGAHVTLTNAAREGARAGTVYLYNPSITNARSTNDLRRCGAIVNAARQSFGLMRAQPPNFSATASGNPASCSGGSASDLNGDGLNDRWVNGDVTVSYCSASTPEGAACPTVGVAGTFCTLHDATGCLVRVELTYRSDIIVPLMGAILSTDGSGRFVHRAVAIMVIN